MRGVLPPEKVAMMEEIGFQWRKERGDLWLQHFQELVEFKERFGHCRVPHNWKENVKLARWVHSLGRSRLAEDLSDEKIQRLDSLGLEWQWLQKASETFGKSKWDSGRPTEYADDEEEEKEEEEEEWKQSEESEEFEYNGLEKRTKRKSKKRKHRREDDSRSKNAGRGKKKEKEKNRSTDQLVKSGKATRAKVKGKSCLDCGATDTPHWRRGPILPNGILKICSLSLNTFLS